MVKNMGRYPLKPAKIVITRIGEQRGYASHN